MARPPDTGGPGDEPQDPNPYPIETASCHTGGFTGEVSGRPDVSCVMSDLVADTHRQRQDRIPHRDLSRWGSLSRTLDLAGTHLEGDLL